LPVKVIISGCVPHQAVAGLQHRAVDGAGDLGRELAGDDRHHRLVQRGQALANAALQQQGAAPDVQRQRDQVGVAGKAADPGRPVQQRQRRLHLAGVEPLQRHGKQQQAVLGAVRRLALQEPAGAREPAARLREVAPVDEVERQPERAACRLPGVAVLGVAPLRALQGLQAVVDAAEEVGRGRQQLQVLRWQGRGPVGQ
jgi:hypothetical protein